MFETLIEVCVLMGISCDCFKVAAQTSFTLKGMFPKSKWGLLFGDFGMVNWLSLQNTIIQ